MRTYIYTTHSSGRTLTMGEYELLRQIEMLQNMMTHELENARNALIAWDFATLSETMTGLGRLLTAIEKRLDQ